MQVDGWDLLNIFLKTLNFQWSLPSMTLLVGPSDPQSCQEKTFFALSCDGWYFDWTWVWLVNKSTKKALIFWKKNVFMSSWMLFWDIIFGTKICSDNRSEALLFQNMAWGDLVVYKKLFWMSETISVLNMFSPGLSLEISCIGLVIQWTICCHIVG